jgi:hypothetical protein
MRLKSAYEQARGRGDLRAAGSARGKLAIATFDFIAQAVDMAEAKDRRGSAWAEETSRELGMFRAAAAGL